MLLTPSVNNAPSANVSTKDAMADAANDEPCVRCFVHGKGGGCEGEKRGSTSSVSEDFHVHVIDVSLRPNAVSVQGHVDFQVVVPRVRAKAAFRANLFVLRDDECQPDRVLEIAWSLARVQAEPWVRSIALEHDMRRTVLGRRFAPGRGVVSPEPEGVSQNRTTKEKPPKESRTSCWTWFWHAVHGKMISVA